MDFQDSPAEARVRVEVRAWLEANVPGAERAGDEVAVGKAWQAKLFANGWVGISWPVEYGGRGGSILEEVVFNEEEARAGAPSRSMFTIALGMVAPTLMRHGTEAQKERFLRAMLSGEECWSQLFSEPEAGSDLAGLRARAVRDGDEWVVNGQKVWTSGAHYREQGLLLARTDPSVPKHKGLTCFVVDMHAPGIDVRPLRQMTGHSHFNEVFLSDVRLPADAVVGDVDDGWNVGLTTLMNERVSLGGGNGAGGGKVDEITRLIGLARQRGLAGNAVVRQRIADAYIRRELIRFLGLRARTARSRGTRPGPEGSVAKLASGLLAQDVGDLALELQGPAGMLAGDDVEDGYWLGQRLQAPSLRIAGGTDEVQRNILGERVLRLPPEPRVDKTTAFSPNLDTPPGRGRQ
jgi:alkylation response protein AidB-like acyl-CoA dehydrogenase